jgi:hypothetical protein
VRRFVTDIFNLLQNSPTYTGGALTVTDHEGTLVTSPTNTAGFEGGRLTNGVWYDTDTEGAALQTTVNIPTKAGTRKWYTEPFDGPFGYSNWPARTNKVTCRKYNPVDTTNITKSGDAAAVLSVVDDTAALTAAGLIGICTSGKVYRLDNSAGVSGANAIPAGAVGNMNQHSFSVYLRGGTGSFGDDWGGLYSPAFIASESYQQLTKTHIPVDSSRRMRVVADAGQIIYFILPQLEEGAFNTPPIFDPDEDTLATVTRPATNLSMPTAGVLPVNDFGIWGEVIPGASGQDIGYLLYSYTVFNEEYGVYADGTKVWAVKKVGGGSNHYQELPFTHTKDTPFQYQAFQSSVYGMGIRVKEQGGAWSAWLLKDDADGRLDAPIASTYQVGARNNASHFAGYYPGLAIIQHSDPKFELERLATLYSGG